MTREAAKSLGIDLKGKTMAIQGFGNAGQHAALLGDEILGLKLVAASDSRGGIYSAKGLDPKAVVEHKLRTGSLQGFPGAEPISNEELLELEVTVLFPAALENVITVDNADKIRCKISCELANGPTTPEADEILHQKGIFVLPDFLANAGGVTVSYFEQVQNTYNFYWPLEEVHQRLDREDDAGVSRGLPDVPAGEGQHETGRLPGLGGEGGRGLQAAGLGIKSRNKCQNPNVKSMSNTKATIPSFRIFYPQPLSETVSQVRSWFDKLTTNGIWHVGNQLLSRSP